MRTYLHMYVQTSHIYARTQAHAPTRTHIHIETHTYIQLHIQKYNQVQARLKFLQDVVVRNIRKLLPQRFRIVVYVRKADSTDLVWNSFVMPFSLSVWVSLIGCLLTLSVAFLLLDRVLPQHRRQEGLLMEFPRAVFSVMRHFCSQGAVLIWDRN
jgi:hypothetical protein